MTNLRLYALPIGNDYVNTYYFESVAAQTAFFSSQTHRDYSEFSYQRKDQTIRIPDMYDTIRNYNYVAYQNLPSTKWFYAFITDMRYISEGMTEVTIETDVLQTWLGSFNVRASFIEREHTKDDTIGKNTVPEGLETGEYKVAKVDNNTTLLSQSGYVVIGTDRYLPLMITLEAPDAWLHVGGGVYNGVYSGINYYYVPVSQIRDLLFDVNSNGAADHIISLFMAVGNIAELGDRLIAKDYLIYPVNQSYSAKKIEWRGITKPVNVDGYEPRNKKLFSFPFCYMNMSNNSGGNAIYHYEKFNASTCAFDINGSVSPSFSVRLNPIVYNGAADNFEEGLNLGKAPISNFASDQYQSWLNANSLNIPISIGSSIASGAAAGATFGSAAPGVGTVIGAVAGAIIGGLKSTTDSLMTMREHSFVPDQVKGNINNGDVIYSHNKLTFTAYHMTIKEEYAKIIDEFFDMYGYKTNRVKVPNSNHRAKWWYTKTVSANIDGSIPMDDLNKIKNIYNNGITFWKDTAHVGHYELADQNVIINN